MIAIAQRVSRAEVSVAGVRVGAIEHGLLVLACAEPLDTEAIADKLEGGGRYLETQGLKGIGEDVTDLIRQNPIPALLIGVGVGVLIAQLVRR